MTRPIPKTSPSGYKPSSADRRGRNAPRASPKKLLSSTEMRFVVALSFFGIGFVAIAACQYTPVLTEVREIVAPSADTPASAAPTIQPSNEAPSATPR